MSGHELAYVISFDQRNALSLTGKCACGKRRSCAVAEDERGTIFQSESSV
jgi:hypothetical protein